MYTFNKCFGTDLEGNMSKRRRRGSAREENVRFMARNKRRARQSSQSGDQCLLSDSMRQPRRREHWRYVERYQRRTKRMKSKPRRHRRGW